MIESKPIAFDAYQALASRYSEVAEQKAENGYIEHPAMRKQLGNVSGLEVLDAGCGPGFLSNYLIENGARVSGFDLSPNMIEIAKHRTKGRADLFVANMENPISTLTDNTFDMVVSSLAIDYVKNWKVPLGEFYRVLKAEGRLVISVQHPLAAYLWYKPKSGFGVQYVEAEWRGFGGEPVTVPDYYRSFSEMINPLIASGFQITEIVDTKPIDTLKDIHPEKFATYSKQPTFMIIDLMKSKNF